MATSHRACGSAVRHHHTLGDRASEPTTLAPTKVGTKRQVVLPGMDRLWPCIPEKGWKSHS
jgi:hypothetical protein